jgi:hypothetical protein
MKMIIFSIVWQRLKPNHESPIPDALIPGNENLASTILAVIDQFTE